MMSLRKIIAGLSPADTAHIPRTVLLDAPTTQAYFIEALKMLTKQFAAKRWNAMRNGKLNMNLKSNSIYTHKIRNINAFLD